MSTVRYINNRSSYMLRSLESELSRGHLATEAPSAYAEAAHGATSDRYAFFPTGPVIEALRETGWAPVVAQQQLVRDEGRSGFQKHLIRFHRREELGRSVLHDSRIELVLMNSHDGGCAFRLFAGVFRLVCANGLVVADASYGSVSIRHSRRTVEEVICASQNIAGDSERIGSHIESFRRRVLSPVEKRHFADRALAIRYKDKSVAPVRPDFLLRAKRMDDQGDTLWQTFNTVQENMIRGSQQARRVGRVRALTGLDAQLNINRNLWELAASYLN